MAKKRNHKEPKAVTVGVWLSTEEYEHIKAAAQKADRTVSNYIRLTLRDKLLLQKEAR